MKKLYSLFYILDVTAIDCRDALLIDIKDYEEAVISCCANHNKIDYIVTRNIKDYNQSKVKAILVFYYTILPLKYVNLREHKKQPHPLKIKEYSSFPTIHTASPDIHNKYINYSIKWAEKGLKWAFIFGTTPFTTPLLHHKS